MIQHNKQALKALIPRSVRYFINKVFSKRRFDEIDLCFKLLSGVNNSGVLFDVGAHYGEVSALFSASGWVVYAFEPDKKNRDILNRRLLSHKNVRIIDKAVSNEVKNDVAFYSSSVSTGISTLSPFHSTHKMSEKIQTTTLDAFVKENHIESLDFLKIDTEGFDYFVLKGFPWELMCPKVILCEFENRKTTRLGYTFKDLAEFLVGKNYSVIVSEWYPIREYGGRHRWRAIKEYPCELEEEGSWGNLIALQGTKLKKAFMQLSKDNIKHFPQ